MKTSTTLAVLFTCVVAAAIPRPTQADVLIADNATQSVKRFTTDGVFVDDFVAPGSGGLLNIRGINFGSDGNLYAADNIVGDGAVRRYNGLTGAYIDDFISGTQGSNYLAFDAVGNLYHNDSSVVKKYDASGVLIDPLFVPLGAANQFAWSPADGKFYVYDSFEFEIDRFLDDGTLDDDGLASPVIQTFGFAIDSAGNIYTVARPNVAEDYVLYKFDLNGTLLATSCEVLGNVQSHVAVGPDDVPYVAAADTLYRVDPNSPTLDLTALSTTPGLVAVDILVTSPSGPPPKTCASDLNGDGNVDVVDLLQLLADWGPCSDCP